MTGTSLVVGVAPGVELSRRERLFRALEAVLEVRFVPAETAPAPDCLVVIGSAGPVPAKRVLQYAEGSVPSSRAVGEIRFGESPFLDRRLHGRSLVDRAAMIACELGPADVVMATDARGVPIWTKLRDAEVDSVAFAAPTLAEGEALRDHVSPGRFIALLPLLHFLRDVLAARGPATWEPPPLRATFIVDDPNLRWTSYGPLNYRRLAEDAKEHGYHIGMATVPLDARMTSPSAARIFRDNGDVLSLSIHGNDHDRGELGKRASRDDAARVLAQALRRVERLEERRGVIVSRVMVPPHEACTSDVLSLLMLLGYEGVCMTRPHPWISVHEQSSPYATSPEDVDAGWAPAVMRPDGFPVFLRRHFSETDEILLGGYLDQPLVFYGHIGDLLAGLDALRAAAAEINSLGPVRWCSLGELAASNYLTARPAAGKLQVKPFARRVALAGLDDIEELEILWQAAGEGRVRLVHRQADGRRMDVEDQPANEPIRLRAGTAVLDATFISVEAVDPASIESRRTAARALVRRFLTEARDRALPSVRAFRGAVPRS